MRYSSSCGCRTIMSRTCANGCGYARSCPGPVQTVAVTRNHVQDLCKRLRLCTIISRTCANGCGYAQSCPGPVQTVAVTHDHFQDLCKRLWLRTIMSRTCANGCPYSLLCFMQHARQCAHVCLLVLLTAVRLTHSTCTAHARTCAPMQFLCKQP